MDIRAVGKGFEEYKIRGGNHSNITYVRGRVAEITEGADNNPVVTYEDTTERKVKSEAFDLVILATACAPTKGIVELSKILGIELDQYNFVKTSPLSPVDTTDPGNLCLRMQRGTHGCAGICSPGLERCCACR